MARRKRVPVRKKTGVNNNDGTKRSTAAIQNVDGCRSVDSRRTTGANKNADSAGNTGSNMVGSSNTNRQKSDYLASNTPGWLNLQADEQVMGQWICFWATHEQSGLEDERIMRSTWRARLLRIDR